MLTVNGDRSAANAMVTRGLLGTTFRSSMSPNVRGTARSSAATAGSRSYATGITSSDGAGGGRSSTSASAVGAAAGAASRSFRSHAASVATANPNAPNASAVPGWRITAPPRALCGRRARNSLPADHVGRVRPFATASPTRKSSRVSSTMPAMSQSVLTSSPGVW